MILLSDTDLAGAELLAERIRNTVELHTLSYDMATIKITASLGVGSLRADDTVESFIKRADDAMYKARKRQKSIVLAS